MFADKDQALALLQGEMRLREGPVPPGIAGAFRDDGALMLSNDELRFALDSGLAFHYRRGEGIVAHLPDESLRDDLKLYAWGTIYGAVAWMNAMMPLHASAVERGGRCFAFTADSGGGKSTLAAALTQHGYSHICDDTLVVAPVAGGIAALPDAKPLKLWDSALGLTGSKSEGAIHTMPGKHYVQAARKASKAAMLGDLFFLEPGPELALKPIVGAAKASVLPDAMYRANIHASLADPGNHARLMTRVLAGARFWRLTRPIDPGVFDDTTAKIADALGALD